MRDNNIHKKHLVTNVFDLTGLIDAGNNIQLKHYSTFEFLNAYATNITENTLKIKVLEKLSDLNLFPEDPVVLSFTMTNDLYIISGEILKIEKLFPLEISIKIKQIEKQKTLRKNKRFFVSLACEIITINSPNTVFGIVKNVSYTGFKMNSKTDMFIGDSISLSISLDKYHSICCICTVVRKDLPGSFYEYGLLIKEISELHRLTLNKFIEQIKSEIY